MIIWTFGGVGYKFALKIPIIMKKILGGAGGGGGQGGCWTKPQKVISKVV